MPLGLMFWILMLIWAVFGVAVHLGYVGSTFAIGTNNILLLVLFGLLGWQVFGAPLHK